MIRFQAALRRRRDDSGFVLLLAFFGALVLLLSSLSVQTAALQSRSTEFILRKRRQQEDALASAAQLIAARLAAFPCALRLPLQLWTFAPTPLQQPCMTADAMASLRQSTLPPPDAERGRYELNSYEPMAGASGVIDAAELTLTWIPMQGRVSKRRFRLMLASTGSEGAPLLQGVRP